MTLAGTESDTGKPKVKHEQVVNDENPEVHSTGSDDVLTIPQRVPKQKKLKKRAKKTPDTSSRRLKFVLDKNTTQEFHKHARVATQSLERSERRERRELKSAIK